MKSELGWIFITSIVISLVLFTAATAKMVMLLAWTALFSGFVAMTLVVYHGRKAKMQLHETVRGKETISTHTILVAFMTCMIIVGVVGIEVAIQKVGGHWGNSFFLTTHLFFAIPAAVALVAAGLIFNGKEFPERHREYAYPFAVCYTVAFITGTALLLQQFPFLSNLLR